MYQTPNYYRNRQENRLPPPPEPKKRKLKLRIAWVLAPLVCIFAWWIWKNATVTIFWEDLLDAIGIKDRLRYTKLACLFAVLLGVVCLVKILTRKDKK